jgi:hypothetical protein
MFVGRMWNSRDISIFVSISGLWEGLVRHVIDVDYMIKRMRSKVSCILDVRLIQAIQEARTRATQEYLTRHPNGIHTLSTWTLILAVKAVHANVRQTYLARRRNITAPVIGQSIIFP